MSVAVSIAGSPISASVAGGLASVVVGGGNVAVSVAPPVPVAVSPAAAAAVQAAVSQQSPITADVSGAQGKSWQEQFETVSKNLSSRPAVLAYADGSLASVTFSLEGGGQIVKTLNRQAGRLASIVLSGDTPAGVALTKTLSYTGNLITGVVYS